MNKFNFYKRAKSFVYAWKGITNFISKEHNAWIHSTFTLGVVTLSILCNITRTEWYIIILCIALVFAAEAFNSAIERLVNLVSPDYNKLAGEIKDIAAGAVLICAIAAAIIGIIIFLPYIYSYFHFI